MNFMSALRELKQQEKGKKRKLSLQMTKRLIFNMYLSPNAFHSCLKGQKTYINTASIVPPSILLTYRIQQALLWQQPSFFAGPTATPNNKSAPKLAQSSEKLHKNSLILIFLAFTFSFPLLPFETFPHSLNIHLDGINVQCIMQCMSPKGIVSLQLAETSTSFSLLIFLKSRHPPKPTFLLQFGNFLPQLVHGSAPHCYFLILNSIFPTCHNKFILNQGQTSVESKLWLAAFFFLRYESQGESGGETFGVLPTSWQASRSIQHIKQILVDFGILSYQSKKWSTGIGVAVSWKGAILLGINMKNIGKWGWEFGVGGKYIQSYGNFQGRR